MGNLIFLQPWILAGLAALPVLWFLLRVTPPAPRLIDLPSARFLEGLVPERRTPSRTPWWILLIRLLAAALAVVALAGPVLNPGQALPGSGPLRLVIDNGWESAQNWDARMGAAENTLAQAGRENRALYILTTAPDAESGKPRASGPLGQADAAALLRGLAPQPWPADYALAAKAAQDNRPPDSTQSLWFSTGIAGAGVEGFVQTLQTQGGLMLYEPAAAELPLLLRPAKKAPGKTGAAIDAPEGIPAGLPVALQAMTAEGHVLDTAEARLLPDSLPVPASFDLPETLRSQIAQIRIAGRGGAGAVLLLDESARKRSVGIVSPPGEAESAPLAEASYYMTRALEPYATLSEGSVDTLVKASPSMILLPDVGAMTTQELNALEEWVKKGGMLVRFAGPNMAQADSFLTPVPLRKGGRAMDGALTWEQPAHLAPFPESSPLYGLKAPEEITVRRQLLAEPSPDLDRKTWARLSDGTPLITAAPLDSGTLVLVHTTATPEWSDLALSGLYVDLLRRLTSLSSSPQSGAALTGALQPISILDGRGALTEPQGNATPIPAEAFDTVRPGPDHPPGIYGRAGYQVSLNLGERLDRLQAIPELPLGVQRRFYGGKEETDLMPCVLYAALCLLLLDWTVMIAMGMGAAISGGVAASLARLRRASGVALIAPVLIVLCLPGIHGARAAEPSAADLDHATRLYLAYVRTGVASLDGVTQRGLETLVEALDDRTSSEPAGVVAVDPERDEMAFFPLLYWAVTPEQAPLSDAALQNVQSYLNHGGTILFDTRDQHFTVSGFGGTPNSDALRRLIGSLDIPPLVPAPGDHVLTKSFYLMDSFPGRYSGGPLWVEDRSANGRDGVSSVIIGGNDWAAGWADIPPHGRGATRQQEMSLRFGVNLMMYALTGNYKADQVHVPHILERLGQ